MNWRRIFRIFKKELIQTRRDRRMIGFIFFAPVLQLFLFGYAVTSDVNHIKTAVLDEDKTAVSREFTGRFSRSGYFDYDYYLKNEEEIDRALDSGDAQFVLHIPRGFAKAITRGETAQVQTLYDATDATTTRVVSGYVSAITQQYAADIAVERIQHARLKIPPLPTIDGRIRVWYNPELRSVNFMVPGVLCTILLFITTIMTSLAIVKEKELGTLEQLIVTPITPMELMIGKTLPFLLVGMIDLVLILTFAVLWFHIHIAGSILLLVLLSILFLVTTLGLGIFVSTVSRTQQEANMTGIFILLPSVMLSGFVFPIENMPRVIQWITYVIPLRYYLEIIRGIFLKGSWMTYLWPQTLALAVFGIAILVLSARRFSKHLG